MKSGTISTDKITVPEWVDRPFNKIADARDSESIKQHGVRQPLVLVDDGNRLLLAKGLRRLRIAKSLGLGKVPYVIAPVPDDYSAEDYARELRLALDMHRQDLTPSQKCQHALELKDRFGMNNKELAAYLGVDQDSITNWTSVRNYIPEVVAAIDGARLTMGAAKAFDGMTEKGQQFVWKKHEVDLVGSGKYAVHRQIRKLYPPTKFADYYRQPELVAKRLKSNGGAKSRGPTVTAAEKRRLGSSLELKEIELREGLDEERRLKAEIQAAIAPLAAIMRSDRLMAMVPPEMREELDRFAEVYV